MSYIEEQTAANSYKQAYVEGIGRLIENRQESAAEIRSECMRAILDRPEPFREELKQMLGWPLVDHPKEETSPCVTAEKLVEEDGYAVFRMRFTVLDDLQMTGLFFRAESEKPLPLVLVQHGGQGTPEFIAGMYGDTGNYNDMLQRVKQHGVHMFAPQLLLWHDDYGVPYDRVSLDARLKRVGSSITAVEVYGLTRILDYFETQDFVSCFGMVGLSYGGFYTLFTTALDTRIRSAVSCAFFNSRDAAPWCDWTWFRSAELFDDAEVACLVHPRRLCLEIADHDELFDYRKGEQSFEKLKAACQSVGTDWVELIVFDGCHEFCKDDRPIERLINDLK
ncbi:MAG: hypothetical protein IJC17_05610 [Clostridia bacterium]|nr:hypothetical protein [Clostridia bacterium]